MCAHLPLAHVNIFITHSVLQIAVTASLTLLLVLNQCHFV